MAALCQNVIADRARSGAPPPGEVDRSGRGKLVFGGILYGIWAGVALDIMADIDDGRALVIPPLVGGAVGLAVALQTTREGEITNAQAWARITGFDYGTYSGLIWGAAAEADEKVVAGSALGAGLAGGIAAILLTRNRHPLQGDVEMVRSGGLWGFATGGLLAAVVQPDQSSAVFTMMGLGMDGGLAHRAGAGPGLRPAPQPGAVHGHRRAGRRPARLRRRLPDDRRSRQRPRRRASWPAPRWRACMPAWARPSTSPATWRPTATTPAARCPGW